MLKLQKEKRELGRFLSNNDFKKYLNEDVNNKILTYADLKEYNNILHVLPNEKDYRIVLIQEKPNSGHWCCLIRNHNNIMWFDSYGISPDGELKFINKDMNILLGQNEHQIHRLMKTAPSDFTKEYNHFDFQSFDEDIATCGRWVMWAILMNNLNYSLDEMKEFIERWTYELDKDSDILIIEWIC